MGVGVSYGGGNFGAATALAIGIGLQKRPGAAGDRASAARGRHIPETVRSGTTDVATLGFIGGFAVMMALDNALG
jgi:hypothetical protein